MRDLADQHIVRFHETRQHNEEREHLQRCGITRSTDGLDIFRNEAVVLEDRPKSQVAKLFSGRDELAPPTEERIHRRFNACESLNLIKQHERIDRRSHTLERECRLFFAVRIKALHRLLVSGQCPREIGEAIKASRSACQPLDQIGIVGHVDELREQDECSQPSFLALQLFEFACDRLIQIDALVIQDLLDLAQAEFVFSKR